MHFIKLVIFILTFSSLSFGQISFYNTYSNGGYDSGEGIVQLADSSYIITGSSSSFTDNNQAFLMQIDSLGNRKWSKHYGGLESDKGRRLFHVPNDGIYVAGQSNSFGNFYDVYFFKTDNQGNLLYEKNYGSSAYENIFDAVMLKDTSFILVGETYNTSNETENIYLLRINKFGDTLWTKNFGTEQKDVARGIKLLNDTTVVIAGEYYVADSLTQKAMLIKMHIDGSIEWLKTYGNLGKYGLNDLSIENGEIRAVGYNLPDLNLLDNNDHFLLRCDANGLADVNYSEAKNGDFFFEAILKYGSNPDDYYIASRIERNDDFDMYLDGNDIGLYKFHRDLFYNGVQFSPSNDGNDICNEMIATSDGGAIIIAQNNKPTTSGSNVLVVKIGAADYFPYSQTIPSEESLLYKEEFSLVQNQISISPNPSSSKLYLNQELSYEIVDKLGKTILVGNSNEINIENLESGIYFLKTNQFTYKFSKI